MKEPDDMTQESNSSDLEEIVRELMTAIAKGTFKPGQRLVELQLCELFGAKRSKIREALRKLEHEGFVTITRNVGAVVTRFSRRDVEEIYDMLAVLEGMAVRIATPFITPEQLKRLELLLERMEAANDPPAFHDLNDTFHTLLDSYSENRRLIKVTENLRASIPVFGFQSFFAPGQLAASIRDHRQIVEAMKNNMDKKAEQVMRLHLLTAKNRLIKWMYKSL